MIKNWKNYRDNNDYSAAISKAFDTINHYLLIAKLQAYGMERNLVMLIMNYLGIETNASKLTAALVVGKKSSQAFHKYLF